MTAPDDTSTPSSARLPAGVGAALLAAVLIGAGTPLAKALMAGIGPRPMGVPGATHCDYCTMADRCPYHGKHGAI